MMKSEPQYHSPYRGLIPYEQDDAPFFFGREKETRLIAANLFAAPLTVLYGASGAGKSSVLRAGVINHLRPRGDLLIVEFHNWQSDPLTDFKAAVTAAAAGIGETGISPRDSAPLAEYLAVYSKELDRRVMIILDQFEEYFLYHAQGDAFAAEFPQAVMLTDAPISFLISMREDALAKLDRFEGHIPNLFDNYLRIEHLDRESARAAIERPIGEYNRLYAAEDQPVSIEPALVEAVLEQVKTGQVVLGEAGRGLVRADALSSAVEARIETPYLQLVMTRLWREEKDAGSHVIRLDTLNRLGGAEHIVQTHLDDVMSALPPAERDVAASIFQYLVTPAGHKIAFPILDLAGEAGLEAVQLISLVQRLSHGGVHILRAVGPAPGQPGEQRSERYEIFHDVLAPAILDWRTRYLRDQKRAEAERQAAEEARKLEQEAVQQREKAQLEALAKANAKAARLWRWLVVTAVVALVFVGLLMFEAIQQRRLAWSLKLATDSLLNLERDPELSVLLSLQAVSQTYSEGQPIGPKVLDSLQRAVYAQSRKFTLFPVFSPPVKALKYTFSLDGRYLATGGGDNVARVWEVTSGGKVAEMPHDKDLKHLTFSLDGRYLATGGGDNVARVWEVNSGGKVAEMPHDKDLKHLTFSLDGRYLATADDSVQVWELPSGRTSIPLSFEEGERFATFSPDGQYFVTLEHERDTHTRTLRLREVPGRLEKDGATESQTFRAQEVARLPLAEGESFRTFSPDGRYLATAQEGAATGDPSLRVWEVPGGREVAEISAEDDERPVALSPDGRYLATAQEGTATRDQTFRVREVRGGREVARMAQEGSITSIVFSADGQRIATASKDETVKVWDAFPGRAITIDAVPFVNVALSDTHLITTSRVGEVKVWDTGSGQPLFTIYSRTGPMNRLALSFDGRRLATGGYDGVQVWELASGREVALIPAEKGERLVALSLDGRYLTTASDNTARVWEVDSGQKVAEMPGKKGERLVALSPDGRYLATAQEGTATRDQTFRVREVRGGREVARMAQEGSITSIVFSADGQLIATASKNGMVKVWDVVLGKEINMFSTDTTRIKIALSSNGRFLAIVDNKGEVRVLPLNDKELLMVSWTHITRKLTDDECKSYLHVDQCQSATAEALDSLIKGYEMAREGKVENAVASFQYAQQLDSSIQFDLQEGAKRLAVEGHVRNALRFARSEDIEGAAANLREVQKLNPDFHINPEVVARRLTADVHFAHALRFARRGDMDGARSNFQRAEILDPAISMARRRAAPLLEKEGVQLAIWGRIRQAKAALEGAEVVHPEGKIRPSSWNALCWRGSLHGFSDEVMTACNKAVSNSSGNVGYRDSRGLARACSKEPDYEGAIDDFQFYVEKGKSQGRSDTMISKRQAWIEKLKKLQSPCDELTLEKLRDER